MKFKLVSDHLNETSESKMLCEIADSMMEFYMNGYYLFKQVGEKALTHQTGNWSWKNEKTLRSSAMRLSSSRLMIKVSLWSIFRILAVGYEWRHNRIFSVHFGIPHFPRRKKNGFKIVWIFFKIRVSDGSSDNFGDFIRVAAKLQTHYFSRCSFTTVRLQSH